MIEAVIVSNMGLYILYKECRNDSFLHKKYKISAQFIEFSNDLNKNTCYLGVIYYLLYFNFDGMSDSVLAQQR